MSPLRSRKTLRRRVTKIVALIVSALLSDGGHAWSERAVPVREADAVCGRCHRDILDSYLKTPMANASGLADERLFAGSYQHQNTGAEYSVSGDPNGALLHFRIPATPPIEGSERLRYFLGSGHLGLTYLYEKNNYWFESPIAYYDALHGYGMKPGLELKRDLPSGLGLHPACLRCHMSGVEKQAAGSDNLYPNGPFRQTGVTCESCHGSARQHVATGGTAAIVNPVKLDLERRDSVCVVCHLEGDTSVERHGRNILDFKPGENVADYLAYFIYAGEITTGRAVSEIEQFNSSLCKRTTGPQMSCTTCHNPHFTPAPEQSAAFFRGKCLTCHKEEKLSPVHTKDSVDCVSCHMPKTGARNVPHVAWTDHRILRRPEQHGPSLSGPAEERASLEELIPVLGSSSTNRDLGLAYSDLAIGGATQARSRAWQLLTAAEKESGPDAPLLRALGLLSETRGDHARAELYYRSALQVDPEDLVSETNLGALLANSGDLEAAANLWRRSFQVNEDVPSLGQNLAIAECLLGQRENAEQVLQKLLAYNPAFISARQILGSIETGQRTCLKPSR